MNPNQGTVGETPAERSLSQIAMARLNDFQQRWMPLQQRLATTVARMGAPGSVERQRAQGRGTAEEGEQFAKAGLTGERQEMSSGQGPAGGGFKTAAATMPAQGKSAAGLASAGADTSVDRAYVSGLQQIMALGRGEKATATSSMAQAAGIQSQQAYADAMRSAGERSMWGGMAGTTAGMGLAAAYGYQPSNPNASAQYGLAGAPGAGMGRGDYGYAPTGYAPGMAPGYGYAPAGYSTYQPPNYSLGV